MGLPFEALLPYGIIIGFFGVSGIGLSFVKRWANDGKRPRRGIDVWDKVLMERDLRLTGKLRGQTDNVTAPRGFELNTPWKVENRIC